MTLTAEQLESYRTRLEEERRRILGVVEALHEDSSVRLGDEIEENGLETHLGDVATATYLRERDITIEEHEEQLLNQLDAALERVRNGTYGVCVRCGNEIPAERLEAQPWAVCDIDCQKEIDGG